MENVIWQPILLSISLRLSHLVALRHLVLQRPLSKLFTLVGLPFLIQSDRGSSFMSHPNMAENIKIAFSNGTCPLSC